MTQRRARVTRTLGIWSITHYKNGDLIYTSYAHDWTDALTDALLWTGLPY